jgi:LPXTG-motif cell wall-anchored protein
MNKNKAPLKTAVVYLLLCVLCVVVTNVYALFGHGIRSDSMDWMFLYPLFGGVVFIALGLVLGRLPRFAANLYHAGLAALTVGSLLRGILEIAGTSSAYTKYFTLAGGLLTLFGAIGIVFKRRRKNDAAVIGGR